MPRRDRSVPPLLTQRAAIILGLALAAGAAAGALALRATGSLTQAILAAGTATAGTISLLNQIISDR